MLRYPFNGEPILTNPYRYKTHLGEDYALHNRTAIIAVSSGIASMVESAIEKKTKKGVRQWVANTPSDPYKSIGFPIVKRSLKNEDYGNYVKIDHGDGISTLYAHLDETLVYAGEQVREGQLIGYSDSTGNSTGGHIHFEIRKNNVVIDPTTFDFSFTGPEYEEVPLEPLNTKVTVAIDTLYVRTGPGKKFDLSGSKELHKGDIVDVIGYTKGEQIESNRIWFKSAKGNYFWSGGTDKPKPDGAGITMTSQEIEARKAELSARKVELDAKEAGILAKAQALEEEKAEVSREVAVYQADMEALLAEPVEEVLSEVVEQPVETPAEEVPAEQPVMDAVDASQEEKINALEKALAELKSMLGK